jgi:hypothetical protein
LTEIIADPIMMLSVDDREKVWPASLADAMP